MTFQELYKDVEPELLNLLQEQANKAMELLNNLNDVAPNAIQNGQNLKLVFMAVFRDGMVHALEEIKKK